MQCNSLFGRRRTAETSLAGGVEVRSVLVDMCGGRLTGLTPDSEHSVTVRAVQPNKRRQPVDDVDNGPVSVSFFTLREGSSVRPSLFSRFYLSCSAVFYSVTMAYYGGYSFTILFRFDDISTAVRLLIKGHQVHQPTHGLAYCRTVGRRMGVARSNCSGIGFEFESKSNRSCNHRISGLFMLNTDLYMEQDISNTNAR